MPNLVLPVASSLQILLHNGQATAVAYTREQGDIIIEAVCLAFVFEILLFRAEKCRTNAACEVLTMVFPAERCYV